MFVATASPDTRCAHTCMPTAPNSAPSTNTMKNSAAASRRALVVSMVGFRHHHQSFIPIGRRPRRIRSKQKIMRFYRTHRNRVRLRARSPTRAVRNEGDQSQHRRGCESPAQVNARLPEPCALADAILLYPANTSHHPQREIGRDFWSRARNLQQTRTRSRLLERIPASAAIFQVLRRCFRFSAAEFSTQIFFQLRFVVPTCCLGESCLCRHRVLSPSMRRGSRTRVSGGSHAAPIAIHDSTARAEQSHFHRVHVELEYFRQF